MRTCACPARWCGTSPSRSERGIGDARELAPTAVGVLPREHPLGRAHDRGRVSRDADGEQAVERQLLGGLAEATRLTETAKKSTAEAVLAANETASAVRETTRSAVNEAKRAVDEFGIKVLCQEFPLEKAGEVYERMNSNQIRFRGVLVPSKK